jgi:Cof subfamily protein (haloacid dehalogenase superfamily)
MSSLSTNPAALPDSLSSTSELQRFSQVELVVLDLDGTLLGHAEDFPDTQEWEKRHHLVNRLKHRGIPLTLATGRAYAGASRAITAVSRNRDTPFILYNGSLVMTAGRTILASKSIDPQDVNEIRLIVEQSPGCAALFYSITTNFSGSLEAEWADYTGAMPAPLTEFNGLPVGNQVTPRPNSAYVAALIWAQNEAVATELFAKLTQHPAISVTTSGGKYLEVRPANSSKAAGLDTMTRYLGIDRSRVLAVGDNDNDVELLRVVGISVCVANASKMAQESSMYKTRYEATTGAIEILELVTRARRLFPKERRADVHHK